MKQNELFLRIIENNFSLKKKGKINKMDSLNLLPPELISQVMTNIPERSLLNLRLANRNLNYISRDDQLWLEIAKREAKYPELLELLTYAREILPSYSIEFLWLNIKEGRAFKGSEFLYSGQRNFYSAGQQASIQLFNYFMRFFNIKGGIKYTIYGAAQRIRSDDNTFFFNLLMLYKRLSPNLSAEDISKILGKSLNLMNKPHSYMAIRSVLSLEQIQALFPDFQFQQNVESLIGRFSGLNMRGTPPVGTDIELIRNSPSYLDLFEPTWLDEMDDNDYENWISFYNRIPNVLKSHVYMNIDMNIKYSILFGYLPTIFQNRDKIAEWLNKTHRNSTDFDHTLFLDSFNIYYYLKYKGFLNNFSIKSELSSILSRNIDLPILPIVLLWMKELHRNLDQPEEEFNQIVKFILSNYNPTLETMAILFRIMTPDQILHEALLVTPQLYTRKLKFLNDVPANLSNKIILKWIEAMVSYSATVHEEDRLKLKEIYDLRYYYQRYGFN